ncbi:MAG: carboxypeptidase regulatory-like domain-containing protein [candidate division Zixibacteria bacterium]|nr:carboxypeptidase regulatory-like domain-containing protein [candidate division Zixibacteria bacterium]
MKKFALLLMAVMLGFILPQSCFAEETHITKNYSFERPEILKVQISGTQYDRIIMPNTANSGNAGQPALPAIGANILLPYNSEVSNIEIITGEKVLIGEDYYIEPITRPVRLSAEPTADNFPIPDNAIYNSDGVFPESAFDKIGVFGFRGYQILTLKLKPVEYIPLTGELYYYPELTVVVNTKASGKSNTLFRGFQEDETEVMSKVDNPDMVSSYWQAFGADIKGYDLLIITTTSLVSSFQPLKDYHDTTGILTEIHTTTDIGSSDPDDIRAYITDRYTNDGIDYVIIGADDDIIPAKDLYVVTSPGGDTEENMPSDVYFACLDGTWNYDNDAYWGEPTDGEGGGDVDLIAEVYVGRASVGNTTEAARFVNKTIWYLTNQHSHPEKVQLVGEYLGFGGPAEYAAETLNELINGSSAHSYTTIGIPSDLYAIDTLYERSWPGNDWPKSELVNRINNGVHFLNHLGHGSPDYAMKLYNSDVLSDLTNTDLCFVYSQTCLAGHLDGTDCWAETMNIKTDYGAFAVIMNARYGFGEYNSTDGPSQRFDREFWDAVFNPAENKPELGRANQDSKEDNLYRVNDECMRWCYYELNLFGDPSVTLAELSGMRVSPQTDLVSEGMNGGPFTPDSMVYTIENLSDYGINYSTANSQPWVTITNGSGYLDVEATADVAVSLNANAESLDDGSYTDIIEFINTTDSVGNTQRSVKLNVGLPGIVYEWNLDTNPGWTTEGQWAYGQPTGGGGSYGSPDPTSGYTGDNVYGYNLNGDYPNSMAETHLTSTSIDCSGLGNVTLKFRRWLGVETSSYDHAYVRVSNDGTNWTTVWSNPGDIADYAWVVQEFDISSIADNQPVVYLRWTMGETDGSVVYCGWNIDDIQLIALGGEQPPLTIILPDGPPQVLEPGVPTSFNVQIVNGEETYVPGSGMLHYRYNGGTYLTSSLTPLGGNIYEATLPATNCGTSPEFYLSADGDEGSTITSPSTAPTMVYSALVGALTVVFDDNFETDQGWTAENLGATSGDWERGIPVNDPDWAYDPTSDADGSGQCCLTQNIIGNTDIDNGAVRLTSPTFDMSSGGGVIAYDYYLYLTNTDGDIDKLLVEINNDNGVGTWTEVARHTSQGGLSWRPHEISASSIEDAGVALTSTMKIRFTANDDDPQSIVEAGIDAFMVISLECDSIDTGVIEGIVSDTYGSVSGVEVNADDGLGNVGSDITEGDGSYSIDIAASTYDVSFSHFSHKDTIITNVIVTVNDTTTVDVLMELLLPGAIDGTVTDASAAPIQGVLVELLDGITIIDSDSTDVDGYYYFANLYSESYNLNFDMTGYYTASETNAAVASGDTTTVDKTLHKPGSYSGIVYDYYGSPVDSVHVAAVQQVSTAISLANDKKSTGEKKMPYANLDGSAPVVINVESVDKIQIKDNNIASLSVKSDGLYPVVLDVNIIEDAYTNSAGEYELVLNPGSYTITFEKTEWTTYISSPFSISDDMVMDNQNIILRSTGSLSGVIDDGVVPIEDVYVIVEDGSRALVGDDYTDQYGNYFIADIYDNDYTISYTHVDYNSITLNNQHINDGQDLVLNQTMVQGGYAYLPGDANMYNGLWPPMVIGGDVTYLVNYFKGQSEACLLDGFYASADANGDCVVMGSDVIRLVNYFRGTTTIEYCQDFEPLWPPAPDEAPAGWPNCETLPVISKVIPLGADK